MQFNLIKPIFAADDLGTIDPPPWIKAKWMSDGTSGQALFRFIGTIIVVATTIAGIFFVVQLITTGYLYINSNGDPKKIEMASQKLLQSLIGIIIVASALTLGTVVGRIAGINITNFSF